MSYKMIALGFHAYFLVLVLVLFLFFIGVQIAPELPGFRHALLLPPHMMR
jgi:hypothetical protein